MADFNNGADAFNRGDYATAIREWEPLAEQGHLLAQINLGGMYLHGRVVPQDCKKAVKWCSLAANQGHPIGLFYVALMYSKGQCVARDTARAAMFYKLSAERGNVDAQANLGLMYGKGEGVPQDYVASYVWLSLAVLNGDKMGEMDKKTLLRTITPEQEERARTLLRHYAKEIDHEHPIIPEHAFAPHATVPTADFNKGKTAYENGDYATALGELRTLAKQRHAEAQHYLANMYQNGLGVPQDYILAYVWHKLAVNNGFRESISLILDLEDTMMTSEQSTKGFDTFMIYRKLYDKDDPFSTIALRNNTIR